MPRAQALDLARLEDSFRSIQAKVHPDKHAHAGDSDRRLAMQWATRVNEAFQTLKSPGLRARYLLGLLGHDPQIESNTAMPTEFLMDQMELREAVMEARAAADEAALDAVRSRLLGEIRADYARLAELIDIRKDFGAAAILVRQLMFQEKLLHEIDDALEAVTS
ncbi:MAG: Fe-S protein assembly co-chaperone HscB [Sterolibacteriaceae bacterium]|nr:Fe-S protein assembly co-chaperone HscB [Sterolibacteriaceae bacterium]